MDFRKANISPPSILDPGSCQAVRIAAILEKPVLLATMTREESERKQLAYEIERAKWRKLNGIVDSK
jgi:hypothetical protein